MKDSLPGMRNVLLLLFLSATGTGFSQTCSISNPDTLICQGTMVSFTLTVSGGTPLTYAWNFGNGFTANTEFVSHTYTTAGNYTPSVVVTFPGGLTCNASAKTIKVRSTPVPRFTITTEKKMCFKGNELCIDDQSVPGTSNAPIKQRVYQLSNGFLQIDTPPYSSQICYKNNTDISGHIYTLVLEVTDTNNCVGRLQKKDSAEVFQKVEQLSYTVDTVYNCNVTHTTFTNTSLIPYSRVSKFKWIFGDGTADSTNWFTVKHAYTVKDTCYPVLVVTDVNNCIDSLKTGFFVRVFFPDSAIHASRNSTQCFKGNYFSFKSKSDEVDLTWGIYDANENEVFDLIVNEDSVLKFVAQTCGRFKVRLIISRGISCVITTDAFIDVMGPNALIDNMTDQVVNGRQCNIKDTVYFKTPVPYLSCTYMNGAGIKHFWNFDDNFAPQCTLDTREGINIGMNCNFSKDSMAVKHYYAPGQERCYQVSLYMIDTISGCDHTRYKSLPLMAPEASPDTNASPPRRGLRYLNDDTVYCLDEPIIFDFRSLLPGCDYTIAYMYLDSACDTCNWVPIPGDSLGGGFFQTSYSYTIDPNGYVTVGLIIGNGNLNGEMCYDTAWYHHFLNLISLDPLFNVSVDQSCGPAYLISFTPVDTIQYHMKSAFWRVMSIAGNYYMDTFRQVFGPTDSIVMAQQRIVLSPGIYNIILTLENINGCLSFELQRISFGNIADFGTLRPVNCLLDSVDFFSDIAYIDGKYSDLRNPNHYWNQPGRAAAGKENVSWDVGDGNGFSLTGGSVRLKYSKPGTYSIRMAYQDSIGCKDTITKLNYITVVGTKAHIDTLQNQYYCAPQIVLFNSLSFVYDSLPVVSPSSYDTIARYQWIFGDNTPESGLKAPAHNYTRNGIFDVRMIATSGSGCSDTDYTRVKITGPMPSFTIIDTLGCVPFTVVLDNTTGQPLKSWTWYFGDSANQTFTTLTDSAVWFTYTKPGVYPIRLLGTQDVLNPTTGNTINCNSFFPDPDTNLPVSNVYVKPILPVNIMNVDSICINEKFLLIANADSTYTKFVWRMSNGDSLFLARPDSVSTYSFDSTGSFAVDLIPVENPTSLCWDSATTTMRVLSVLANFDIDSSRSPAYFFRNTSIGSTVYRWDFGKPVAGAKNESNSVNGEFDFGRDTASYSVCLFVLNDLGCWDSICKPVRINQKRLIIPNVFTPDNGDGYNDAFDIDILGFTAYHLVIYNRWGTRVFESMQDGYENDGINWNGNDHQTGAPCAAGTYYYIFTYKFYAETKSEEAHGTITLIRNK